MRAPPARAGAQPGGPAPGPTPVARARDCRSGPWHRRPNRMRLAVTPALSPLRGASALASSVKARSPIMPPLPWCSGQVTEVGSDEIAPAMATIATGAKANLPRQASSGWPLLSGRAQNRGGSRTRTPARPSSLHQQVGRMAPRGPSRLRMPPLVHVREAGIGGRPGERGARRSAAAGDEHAGSPVASQQPAP